MRPPEMIKASPREDAIEDNVNDAIGARGQLGQQDGSQEDPEPSGRLRRHSLQVCGREPRLAERCVRQDQLAQAVPALGFCSICRDFDGRPVRAPGRHPAVGTIARLWSTSRAPSVLKCRSRRPEVRAEAEGIVASIGPRAHRIHEEQRLVLRIVFHVLCWCRTICSLDARHRASSAQLLDISHGHGVVRIELEDVFLTSGSAAGDARDVHVVEEETAVVECPAAVAPVIGSALAQDLERRCVPIGSRTRSFRGRLACIGVGGRGQARRRQRRLHIHSDRVDTSFPGPLRPQSFAFQLAFALLHHEEEPLQFREAEPRASIGGGRQAEDRPAGPGIEAAATAF
eukprot:11219416-Lingulodinium_polyedra.AAC.4